MYAFNQFLEKKDGFIQETGSNRCSSLQKSL